MVDSSYLARSRVMCRVCLMFLMLLTVVPPQAMDALHPSGVDPQVFDSLERRLYEVTVMYVSRVVCSGVDCVYLPSQIFSAKKLKTASARD